MKILDKNLLFIIHKWNIENIAVNTYNKPISIYNNTYKISIKFKI